MADVQVNNSPSTGTPGTPVQSSGGGSGAAWAVVVVVLLAIVAWFVFGSGKIGGNGDKDITINAKVETPAATPAPAAPATKTP